MQKSKIKPSLLQQTLDSGSNALDKGQSQWFTPLEFARKICTSLPFWRGHVADLTCGAGHLLFAAANSTTSHAYGWDIDPCGSGEAKLRADVRKAQGLDTFQLHRIVGDTTQLYPLAAEVDLRYDLLVLNFPFGIFWSKERLADLAQSELLAVREAFAAEEARAAAKRGHLDSTIAGLMIALDRLSLYGEGLVVCNHHTIERLMYAADAPFGALLKHVWARLVVPGNPMTGDTKTNFGKEAVTDVLYFARDHDAGPRQFDWPTLPDRAYRLGVENREWYASKETGDRFQAVRERWSELQGAAPRSKWNLFLTAGDVIGTQLSLFESSSVKLDKEKVRRLHALRGRHPMQLVLEREHRTTLLKAAREDGWRVEPALLAAVEAALQDYQACRAPLYPLPKMQRLGYLDEESEIACVRDLGPFKVGIRYPVRSQTVQVKRKVKKPNPYTGEKEDVEYTGQHWAFYLDPQNGEKEYAFLDPTLREEGVSFPDLRQKPTPPDEVAGARYRRSDPDVAEADSEARKDPIDYTSHELSECFECPDPPDVARVHPERYRGNLDNLTALENLTESLAA